MRPSTAWFKWRLRLGRSDYPAYQPLVRPADKERAGRGVAAFAHFSAFCCGSSAQLWFYALSTPGTYARREAAKAFNFQLIALVAFVVSACLGGHHWTRYLRLADAVHGSRLADLDHRRRRQGATGRELEEPRATRRSASSSGEEETERRRRQAPESKRRGRSRAGSERIRRRQLSGMRKLLRVIGFDSGRLTQEKRAENPRSTR